MSFWSAAASLSPLLNSPAHGEHMAAKLLDEKLDALIAKATDS
jgi:hypothetical protein